MSNSMLEYTCGSIRWHHAALLRVTSDLTPEQFNWRPGPLAPPIGWHLWHIARWADWVQMAMPERDGLPRRQIWETQELALRYELDTAELGPCQTGEGMAHEAAAHLPQAIGQEHILDYPRRAFATLDEAVDQLTPAESEWVRPNSRPFTVTEDRRFVAAPAKEEPLCEDLTFHISHTGRHLGMIEALRGAQGFLGTASV